ncbi:MAG TPA: NUMOD4 domain-containing protein [Arsenophonus nasoniae]|uniref:NUMOD4 domain-containing protein n=1 Tax=Arsenophonus nasoniae TaxID=638 RepID=UPI003879CD11
MNNTESEVWKSIAGFEERYEVSNKGQVRSISRTVPLVSKYTRKNSVSRKLSRIPYCQCVSIRNYCDTSTGCLRFC